MSNLNPNTIQDRAKHIMKCFGQDNDIQKGGQGSRGGIVIGRTKSGKYIYEKHEAHHPSYKDFTKEDHSEAEKIHKDKAGTFPLGGKKFRSHYQIATGHASEKDKKD